MFDFTKLRPEHVRILETLVPAPRNWVTHGFDFRKWDVAIRPDGEDYIFRWHILPRRSVGAGVYLHLQVASDPERPLHDHPYDNQSVILAGGYREVFVKDPARHWYQTERVVREGDVVQRKAEEAHRLFLLPGEDYTISLFSMGPVVREWGFWFIDPAVAGYELRHWRHHDECVVNERFIGEPHVNR